MDIPLQLEHEFFSSLTQPLVCWTSDENPFGADPDEYFNAICTWAPSRPSRFLGMTTRSCPARPTSVSISITGHFFNALRGRTWLLKPGVVGVEDGNAKLTYSKHQVTTWFLWALQDRRRVSPYASWISAQRRCCIPARLTARSCKSARVARRLLRYHSARLRNADS